MPTTVDELLCARKFHHQTERAAMSLIRRYAKDYAGCHAYRCPVCGEGWLIGHMRTARAERREEVTA